MSLNLKEEFIETANLRLAALISDNREDPPVIALHGWLDNAASFTPLANFLSGIRLIAIDFPGHGKSEHRTGANAYHFVDYAADIILAADELGLGTVHFTGSLIRSWGGSDDRGHCTRKN